MTLSVLVERPVVKTDHFQIRPATPFTTSDLSRIYWKERKTTEKDNNGREESEEQSLERKLELLYTFFEKMLDEKLEEEDLLENNMEELKKFLLDRILEDGEEDLLEDNFEELKRFLLEKILVESEENEEPGISEEINSRCYKVGKRLGRGGFGVVFEATCEADGLEVALKYAAKRPDNICLADHLSPVPLEVALMQLVSDDSTSSNIIQLIDWKEHADYYVMVVERFSPCLDLFDYLKSRDHSVPETEAGIIMRQVVQAAVTCCERGVFHRDVKLENILINSDTLQIKLIDFGCGRLMKSCAYDDYCGTDIYQPPECTDYGTCHAKPATVFSLGMVLYFLICGAELTNQDKAQIDVNTWSRSGLTKECCDFICGCLRSDPVFRLPLDELLLHCWFQSKTAHEPRKVQSVNSPEASELDVEQLLLTEFHEEHPQVLDSEVDSLQAPSRCRSRVLNSRLDALSDVSVMLNKLVHFLLI